MNEFSEAFKKAWEENEGGKLLKSRFYQESIISEIDTIVSRYFRKRWYKTKIAALNGTPEELIKNREADRLMTYVMENMYCKNFVSPRVVLTVEEKREEKKARANTFKQKIKKTQREHFNLLQQHVFPQWEKRFGIKPIKLIDGKQGIERIGWDTYYVLFYLFLLEDKRHCVIMSPHYGAYKDYDSFLECAVFDKKREALDHFKFLLKEFKVRKSNYIDDVLDCFA